MIYNYLNIPKKCEVNSFVPKKTFYEKGNLNTREKELFIKYIEKITWKYSLKESNINIKKFENDEFEYDEVVVLEVELKVDDKCKKISKIINKSIPYPLIIVFRFLNKFIVSASHKRINLVDESKNVVNKIVITTWINFDDLSKSDRDFIDHIDIKNLSFSNFYHFYNDFINIIKLHNTSIYSENIFDLELDIDQINEIHNNIKVYDDKIIELEKKLKNEKHFNRKLELNVNLHEAKEEREKYVNMLS